MVAPHYTLLLVSCNKLSINITFIYCTAAGHEEIIRWLINNDLTGTIALIQDNNGDTPAHDAADNGYIAIRTYIEMNALNYQVPLFRHTEILKILLDNGADIHAANKVDITIGKQSPSSLCCRMDLPLMR